jgi:uncharacterized protein
MTEIVNSRVPFVPAFILKYPLPTHQFLSAVKARVLIIHGDEDAVIPINASQKLALFFKPGDELIVLRGQGHNGITDHPEYTSAVGAFLD